MATKSFFLLPVTEEAENVLTLLAVDLKNSINLTNFLSVFFSRIALNSTVKLGNKERFGHRKIVP